MNRLLGRTAGNEFGRGVRGELPAGTAADRDAAESSILMGV
jgi:hypothetical protein